MDKQTDQDIAIASAFLPKGLVIFGNVFFFFCLLIESHAFNRLAHHNSELRTAKTSARIPQNLNHELRCFFLASHFRILRYFYDNDTRNDSVSFSSHTNASARAYSPTLSFNRILVFDFRSVLVFFVTTIVEMLKKYFVGIST